MEEKNHQECKHKHHHPEHKFVDIEKWTKIFEEENRDEFQQSEELIKLFNLKEDSVVADIGAGSGYFPLKIYT